MGIFHKEQIKEKNICSRCSEELVENNTLNCIPCNELRHIARDELEKNFPKKLENQAYALYKLFQTDQIENEVYIKKRNKILTKYHNWIEKQNIKETKELKNIIKDI